MTVNDEIEAKSAKVVRQVRKLVRYIDQRSTREINVGEVLGKAGTKMLNNLEALSEDLGELVLPATEQ